MRLNNDIKHLTELGQVVEFPVYNQGFSTYKSMLRNILYENFGLNISGTLEYSDDEENFYVVVIQTYDLGQNAIPNHENRVVTELRTNFEIDPKQELMPQLKRLEEVIKSLQGEAISIVKSRDTAEYASAVSPGDV
jgi:hypothetical protein